jgi:hypothetical protein
MHMEAQERRSSVDYPNASKESSLHKVCHCIYNQIYRGDYSMLCLWFVNQMDFGESPASPLLVCFHSGLVPLEEFVERLVTDAALCTRRSLRRR